MKRVTGLALGVLTAIGGFVDMGGIITAGQAGAEHRYALLWTLVPGLSASSSSRTWLAAS